MTALLLALLATTGCLSTPAETDTFELEDTNTLPPLVLDCARAGTASYGDMEVDYSNICTAFNLAEAERASNTTALVNMESKWREVSEDIDAMRTIQSVFVQHFADIDAWQEDADARWADLESWRTAQDTWSAETESAVVALGDDLFMLAGDVLSVSAGVTANSISISATQTDIANNATTISSNSGAIYSNSGAITTNTQGVGNNASGVALNTDGVTTNSTTILAVQGDVTTLEAGLLDVQEDIDSLEGSIVALGVRVTDLENVQPYMQTLIPDGTTACTLASHNGTEQATYVEITSLPPSNDPLLASFPENPRTMWPVTPGWAFCNSSSFTYGDPSADFLFRPDAIYNPTGVYVDASLAWLRVAH
jgi:hypothetical protein